MTRIEFDQMVERLEEKFRGREEALNRSAFIWALMGYLVLVIALGVSLSMLAGVLWLVFTSPSGASIKLGLLVGIAALMVSLSILKGAWVRTAAPTGRRLTEKEAPELFRMIASTSKRAGGIRLHRVLLNEELNACVVQVPLLGVFGYYRNYLCLGMQLLDALSVEEFHAVLAHEFAHLSNADGRRGSWLYRIRTTWENVATSLAEQGGMLVKPLALFFKWFWPRFNARAFVLSRKNEYQADAFSAQVTSPEIASRALMRIAVESQRLDETFWKGLNQRAASDPLVPNRIYADAADYLKRPLDQQELSRWISQEMARVTNTADTHPALKDRLNAIRAEAQNFSMEPVAMRASDSLLGSSLADEVRMEFSREWSRYHQEMWQKLHQQGTEFRQELEKLESHTDGQDPVELAWKKLQIRANLHGTAVIADELTAFLDAYPNRDEARYLLGKHLLSCNQGEGVAMLERVMRVNPHATMECLSLLAAYHDRLGDASKIRELKERADRFEELAERAIEERMSDSDRANFVAAGLSPVSLQEIQTILTGIPEVAKAWIALRQAKIMPELTSYAMIVELQYPTLKFVTEETSHQSLVKVVNAVSLEGHLVVFSASGKSKSLAKKIAAIPGSLCYEKAKH